MRVAFVCVNVGPRYPMTYVEILRDMVLRNASNMEHEQAFFCLTDRPDELPEGVYPIPAPDGLPGWWAKVALFSPEMPWEDGDRIVYFDLDVAITGRLEDLVERKGIIQDWHWPCRNSSVMVWDHGEHREIWDRFTPEVMARSPGRIVPKELLPHGQINGGDQEWITWALFERGNEGGAPFWHAFPAGWFVSYRDAHAWPPNGCKAVIFHGNPKPDEILDGWVPNIWRVGGFTSLPEFKGVNTTVEQRMDNVRSSVQRDLPWFTGFRDEGRTVAIVCGAPSMKDCLPEIRAQKRRGVQIVTVNNAWRFLVENGIVPNVNVMLDARPGNAAFVTGAPKSMRFLVASQCHPDVLDALEGYEVSVWHSGHTDNEPMRQILDPWWEGPNAKPCILVPGGSTVGLRSLWLAAYSGFRTIHLYGIDSSYSDDGTHHAYSQTLNDAETIVPAVLGEKQYRCALWMLRQAEEFQETWRDMLTYTDAGGRPSPVTLHVHGNGLIPDIARNLRQEARAA